MDELDIKSLDDKLLLELIENTKQELKTRKSEFDIWNDNDTSGHVDGKALLQRLRKQALERGLISEKDFLSIKSSDAY